VIEPLSYDLNEILPAIEEELYSRLDANLSVKDRLAVKTALAKMGARSLSRGMALQASQTSEVIADSPSQTISSVEVESPDFGNELDLWAEQYGEMA
jgi:hypothetical protein